MRGLLTAAAVLALLGGCAGRPDYRAVRGSADRYPAAPSEAVWHLRVGLNVAALMCKGRGRTAVSGAYARLLGRHRALLDAAYRAEQRRHGGGFDQHQTRIYNRFANQRDPAAFCRRAATVAAHATALSSAALAQQAGKLLGQID